MADSLGPVRRRVLVVDDNVDFASNLADLVEALGHHCWIACNGYAAINRASEVRADMVLLAIDLPLMCGFEACQRLRAKNPGKSMQIIAMSGSGDDDERAEAANCGFEALVVKPIHAQTLSDLFRRAGPMPDHRRDAAGHAISAIVHAQQGFSAKL